MKERPIPFNGDMVRAILDGRKTQTRRVVRDDWCSFIGGSGDDQDDPDMWGAEGEDGVWCVLGRGHSDTMHGGTHSSSCPHGQPGDLLYAKEAFFLPVSKDELKPSECEGASVAYQASGIQEEHRHRWGRYRHARFMPKWATRIWLEVTGVRVERVQDISEADVLAEGIERHDSRTSDCTMRSRFARLWDTVNGRRPGCGWDENPFVWCVAFRRVEL